MDQSRLKGTEMVQMDQSGPSGHKWTNWTESDWMDQKDWSEPIGLK